MQTHGGARPKFKANDRVRVRLDNPEATKRTPHYVRGKTGVVLTAHGVVPDYAHDHADDRGPMYSVIFDSAEVFGESSNERVVVDIHEYWLEDSPVKD